MENIKHSHVEVKGLKLKHLHHSIMENIKHIHVEVKGLKLHVAEIGSQKKVVFLHGFPEIWYTWRRQMIAVANAGYRAIAFDFRGCGLSEHPAETEKATLVDLVDDVVGVLDSLGINKLSVRARKEWERKRKENKDPFDQGENLSNCNCKFISLYHAFLVGKDFGAFPAYLVAVVPPERVASVITLGFPFMLPGPSAIPNHLLPKGFNVSRWQEPGRAEADFGRFDVQSVIRNLYILFSGRELPGAGDDQKIMDLFNPSIPLPPWFTEEEVATYASLYEKSGFKFALQVPYRTLALDCGISDPKVPIPALLIMGQRDHVSKYPGTEEYVRNRAVKHFVPDLEIIYIPEGRHSMHEQFPEKVNQLIIEFLDKQSI